MLNIPEDQVRDFDRHIGRRYLTTLLFRWPKAAIDALVHEVREYPSDDEFSKLMTNSIYTKLLTPLDGGTDEAQFAPIVNAAPPDAKFYKIDNTAMRYVTPYDGMYVAGTMALVEERAGKQRVVAIDVAGLLLEPGDVNAWNLAKLFVMQGASYAILLTEHPNLHFPYDAINAITQTVLPTDHLVFKLLWPHLRFQLPLNRAVLESPTSVFTNFRATLYAPFTADARDGMLELLVAGYKGVKDHSGYPTFDFSKRPKKVFGDYGVFLDAYYNTVLEFTTCVAAKVAPDDPKIRDWADYIVDWITGFPSPDDIGKPGVLASTLARIVWDLSIAHAADHETYSFDLTPEQKFLRIRIPPPASKNMAPMNVRKATRWVDRFKMRLAHRMFFEPAVITRLIDVDYAFADAGLHAAQNAFHQELRKTEANLPVRNFMKLTQFPASIQY